MPSRSCPPLTRRMTTPTIPSALLRYPPWFNYPPVHYTPPLTPSFPKVKWLDLLLKSLINIKQIFTYITLHSYIARLFRKSWSYFNIHCTLLRYPSCAHVDYCFCVSVQKLLTDVLWRLDFWIIYILCLIQFSILPYKNSLKTWSLSLFSKHTQNIVTRWLFGNWAFLEFSSWMIALLAEFYVLAAGGVCLLMSNGGLSWF